MRYIIIGGLSDNPNSNIEYSIIEGIANPHILYVALATDKYEYSYNLFKNKLKDIAITLLTKDDLINNTYLDKFNKANILFFAGGDTERLVKLILAYDLAKLFLHKEVLAGVSAGGIMLANCGMGDKYAFLDDGHYYNFKMTKGLGVLNITFCPHYQKEELVLFDEECKKYNLDSYALEDDTAIIFDELFNIKVVKNDNCRSAYRMLKADNYKLVALY